VATLAAALFNWVSLAGALEQALKPLPTVERGEKIAGGSAFTRNIVNGVDTFSYPTVGALGTLSFGIPEGGCTGTLIGCQTFLTAAHCVCTGRDGHAYLDAASCVAAGLPTPASNLIVFFQNAGFFRVSDVAINPDFNFTVGGDVAVLQLAAPVVGIAPSRINFTKRPPYGTPGTIVGFGGAGGSDNAATLGIKRVGGVTSAACPSGVVDANHLCWNFNAPTGPAGVDSTTCNGDSGGPLFTDLGAGLVVAGVTSGGTTGCLPPDVSYDTDVFQYRSWIQDQAGADLNNTTCGSLPQVGTNGAPAFGVSGQLSISNPVDTYSFVVPADTALLRVAMNGESPLGVPFVDSSQFALLVKAGSPPTVTDFDCGDQEGTTFGFCETASPTPGKWYASVVWLPGPGGAYQLTATLLAGAPTGTPASTVTPTPRATATPTPTAKATPTLGACTGDCHSDGQVTVGEILTMVNIALSHTLVTACDAGDANHDGQITVDEILAAVNNALNGCPTPAPISALVRG